MDYAQLIRSFPDFPTKGILFRDITPLLADAEAFGRVTRELAAEVQPWRPQVVVGIESRGFIVAAPLARLLEVGFVPVRKFGKLPGQTVSLEYALEYGTNTLELHAAAFSPGQRVLIVDDLLATGGTAAATAHLVEQVGAQVVGLAFLVELTPLGGRARLEARRVASLIKY